MRNIFIFIWRFNFFFFFLLLEVIAGIFIIRNNNYHKSAFLNSTNKVTGAILTTYNNFTEYFALKYNNQQLAEENARLRLQTKEAFLMNDMALFIEDDTIYKHQYSYLTAKVIQNSVTKRNNYLTLNKGSLHGIEKDMAVISNNAVVGIVKDVSRNFCSVLSMLHKDTRISAKLKNSGHMGTVLWNGSNYRYGTLVDIPGHVKINPGDSVITSGYSLTFPEGILIGQVVSSKISPNENFYTIKIEFSVDYNKIEWVHVIRNMIKDELDNLVKNRENE